MRAAGGPEGAVPDRRTLAAQAGFERLVVQLAAAINARALYTGKHPRLTQALRQLIETLVALCDDRGQDSVTFLLIGDELVVDQHPLRKGGLYQQPVIRTLKRCGIERLTVARGLDPAECHQLVEALALGQVPSPAAHVVVGQIEVEPAAAGGGQGPGTQDEGLTGDELDDAREAFVRFRADSRGGLGRIEELVWGFMDALARSGRVILPVAPLREHDEYTFIHSVNVSLLTLAQAQSFGMQGQTLHSIGVAALLHDVGKLTTPLSVLNKPGRLEEEEWKVMMGHAELGAWHLCGLDGGTALAVLVAYEHHLRFDGEPNYPVLGSPRRPTLASQLTAIADAYDAICTTRPYKKAQSQGAALGILTSRAGTFYDPFLVGNFRRLVGAE